jgi:transposase
VFVSRRSDEGTKMRNKQSKSKASAERVVKDIRRKTRRQFSPEEKIRIVLEGLRGDDSIAELCRKEGPNHSGPRACITLGRNRRWP